MVLISREYIFDIVLLGEKMKKNLVQYIKEIRDKMENLEESQKSYTDEKTLIAFRGEPRDFGKTKLMPSIFREPDMINKESYIFELMSDYNVLDLKKTRIIDKAIESQHYVAISRMLDITFSILPALYFACSNPNELDKDGRVYVFCFPEHYSPHSAYLEAFYNNLMNDKDNITYSKNFKVITHSYSNDRIQAQSGGFIFFPGKEYIPINSVYYEEVFIYAEDKKQICEELNKLFSIREATLFPEKSTRAKLVKDILYNERYKERKVSVHDEIDTCFERIKFEIEVFRNKQSVKGDILLRKLRKEKDDLISYVNFLEIEKEEKQKYIDEIEKHFFILTKLY